MSYREQTILFIQAVESYNWRTIYSQEVEGKSLKLKSEDVALIFHIHYNCSNPQSSTSSEP